MSWSNSIEKNLHFYKSYKYGNRFKKIILRLLHPKIYKHMYMWDFLGNFALSRPLKTKNKREYNRINRLSIAALPEINHFKESVSNASPSDYYRKFYFESDYSKYVLEKSRHIILLHNSWTPQKYLKMSENEFLSQDITLAKVLKEILYNKA